MLSDAHLAKIGQSAIAPEQALTLGWRSRPDGSLLIPYLKPDGSAETCHNGKPFSRWRLSSEQIAELKAKGEKRPGKYRSPKGEGCRLYHSALAIQAGDYQRRLMDRFIPLRITEGELKTECAAIHDPDRITIGLGGVNSWRDRYDDPDQSRPLIDWDEITLQDREVRLCFDSDLEKPQVAAALRELAQFLASKGARVLIEVLPDGLDGDRLGLDDLVHRHGAPMLHHIAGIARSPFKIRRHNGQDEWIWNFSAEPISTRDRNVYLFGMTGQHWRRSADGKDHWQRWNGRHWEPVIGDDQLAAEIERFAQLQRWDNRELSTMRSLQCAFRRSIADEITTVRPGLLPFRNGVLVVSEGKLLSHDPAHGNNWSLPFDFDPAASCEGIQRFLIDRLEDPASVAVVRAFMRSLLTGEQHKCFLEIVGTSNTGKTVLANLLTAVVGYGNCAAMTLQRLEDRAQRFETLKLRGKRLAVFSECQDYSGQLQTLKALTGGDSIGAEVKGGRHVDFTFDGGIVLVGNGPIRASDPTGAVINRRRSLHLNKVVSASDQRTLIEPDGINGWRGELAGELPGLVNWALAMTASDARQALARSVNSLARAEAELRTLLDSDLLAEWADGSLIWEQRTRLQVGNPDSNAEEFLFPSYLRFVARQGPNSRPLSLRTFKAKLVDLLRDTLSLPLPPGSCSHGEYRVRLVGSVVPCLRWRTSADDTAEAPGVIRTGFLTRMATDQQAAAERHGNGSERHGNGETPVGNGWNGSNESESVERMEEGGFKTYSRISLYGDESLKSVTSVPSVPCKGFGVSDPFPYRSGTGPDADSSPPTSADVLPSRPTGPIEPPADVLPLLQAMLAKDPNVASFTASLNLQTAGAGQFDGRTIRQWLDWLKAQPDPQSVEEWDLPGAA